jgi:hypothetical protein
MQTLQMTFFVLIVIFIFLGPPAIGVAISFAAVGKGFRLNWLRLVIPAFCLVYGIFYGVGKGIFQSDIGYAIVVVSAWLLIPTARCYRHWKLRNA